MSIGILGAGALGSGLARAFARSGIVATISNSRGPQSLAELVKELGPSITAGTTEQAAQADMVFVAIRWVALKEVLSGLAKWDNRVVVDCTNPIEWIDPNSPDAKDPGNPLGFLGLKAVDLKGRHSSAVVRGLVPGARLVKAFNHVGAAVLAQQPSKDAQPVAFYSGDDAKAKAAVRALIEKMGFYPVDLGALDVGGPLTSPPFGSLTGVSFIKK